MRNYLLYKLPDNIAILLFNPISWWAENQNVYPLLQKLARQYLHIPATSTPSEIIFSLAGNIVTKNTKNLEPPLVNK